jgi:hypothetical protein
MSLPLPEGVSHAGGGYARAGARILHAATGLTAPTLGDTSGRMPGLPSFAAS